VSIIRCPRAASSNGCTSIGGTWTKPRSIKWVTSLIESRARPKSITVVILRKPGDRWRRQHRHATGAEAIAQIVEILVDPAVKMRVSELC
jgi:hypothetical protein